MDRFMHPPEFRAPPPEAELRPELELTPPPPEFGQGSGPAGEPRCCERASMCGGHAFTAEICYKVFNRKLCNPPKLTAKTGASLDMNVQRLLKYL